MNSTAQAAQSGTVIFDGNCSFCLSQIDGLRKADSGQQLSFIPRQDETVETRFPQIIDFQLDEGILFIDAGGVTSVAADAMYEIYRRLPAYKGFTWLYQVPVFKPFFKAGYRLVAANRRRLGKYCDNGVCRR